MNFFACLILFMWAIYIARAAVQAIKEAREDREERERLEGKA